MEERPILWRLPDNINGMKGEAYFNPNHVTLLTIIPDTKVAVFLLSSGFQFAIPLERVQVYLDMFDRPSVGEVPKVFKTAFKDLMDGGNKEKS